jgi:prepilin peptidase CpaA
MYQQMKMIMVMLLLAAAVYTDIKRDKIQNDMVIFFALTGGMSILFFEGSEKVLDGFKAAAVVMAVLFLLFVIKALGAGDIKLLALIAFFYPSEGYHIVIVSFIAAGLWAMGRMVVRRIKRQKVLIAGETLHFSIPIAISSGIVLFLR